MYPAGANTDITNEGSMLMSSRMRRGSAELAARVSGINEEGRLAEARYTWALSASVGLSKLRDVHGAHPDRVADPNVRELALFAEAIDGCGAHAEALGHVAHRKQRLKGSPRGKMLRAPRLDPIWTQPREKWCQIVPKVGSRQRRHLQ